jgi:hypothetical protein
MLRNYFQRSTDSKKRVNKGQNFLAFVNKEQNVEIDSPASSGGKGKYTKYVNFPWPPLEAALSIFNVFFKQFFC